MTDQNPFGSIDQGSIPSSGPLPWYGANALSSAQPSSPLGAVDGANSALPNSTPATNAISAPETNPNLPSPPQTLASPEAAKKMVLDRIASGESPNYNTIYGGSTFSDFSDHPRQAQVITEGPDKGQTSDAAGRYQFLSSTWDNQAKKLGLKNFSPGNQDQAAWDLAQTTYKAATKRDLLTDAQQGKVDYSALGSQWPSLKSPAGDDWKATARKAGLTDEQIASLSPVEVAQFQQYHNSIGGKGGGAQGKNSPQGGNLQTQSGNSPSTPDMKALLQLSLLQAAFPQHKFTQINYDPFKIEQAQRVG